MGWGQGPWGPVLFHLPWALSGQDELTQERDLAKPRGCDPEKAMAPHSSTLAWKIPGMGEPGGLLSMGSHRVGHH